MNRYKFTRHKPLNGSPDFWRLTAEADGKTRDHAVGNLIEYTCLHKFDEYESAPPAEPIDGPADIPADIFDLTARVAALERECVELRRLLSGVAPMAPRPQMPPGTYYDPPVFPATGPGWPVTLSPVQPLMAPARVGWPVSPGPTCGETEAATK